MTNFQELLDAYEAHRERLHAYRAECRGFCLKLATGFAKYLGVEYLGKEMRFYPPDQVFDPNDTHRYNALGGMLWMDDSFFHLTFALVLKDAVLVPDWISYGWLFKKEGDHFIVQDELSRTKMKIPAEEGQEQSEKLEAFYNSVMQETIEGIEKSLANFLVQGSDANPIGFQFSLDTDAT